MDIATSGKLSSRSNKSGSNKVVPTTMTDTKQKKSKKKKKGRRNSEKPDVDCQEGIKLTSDDERGSLEVEGVRALEGQNVDSEDSSSLAGQTTKLPMLISQSKHPASNKRDSPQDNGTSSSSKLKQAASIYRPDQAVVNSLAQRINTLNMKQKPVSKNGSRSRQNNSNNNAGRQAGGKQSRQNKDKCITKSAPAIVKSTPVGSSTLPGPGPNQSYSKNANESLRWDNVLEDSEEERERIRLYKINRRKRYLAAAQAKGLGWALNYSMSTGASIQITDDFGFENFRPNPGSYTDYSPIRSLRASQGHGMRGAAMVEC